MSRVGQKKVRQYLEERDKGKTFDEIAKMFGVSRQAVAQACCRYSPNHARPLTEDQCAYPNLRKWINDNRITKAEIVRRLGKLPHYNCYQTLDSYLRGKTSPSKDFIDAVLAMTGMTYEECFATE